MTAKYKDKLVWDEKRRDFILSRPRIVTRLMNIWAWVKTWPEVRKYAALAALLRLFQLGKAAFWYDEGVTVVFARLPFFNMVAATAGDVHPPLYYSLIWLMNRAGIPLTEWAARLPSLAFSVLAIYLIYDLVSAFNLSKQAQKIVIIWTILSPLQLHYAQEARMYALLQLEVLAAISFIIYKKKTALALDLIALMYTQNYAVFYIPTLALFAVVFHYGRYLNTFKPTREWIKYLSGQAVKLFIGQWAIYFVIPVLAWLPWFIVLLGQMTTVSAGYWIQPVKFPSILFVLYQMLFAYSMPPTFQGLGVLITCGLLFYAAWKIYKNRPGHWLSLSILAVGPLLLSVIVSLIWRPVLLFRGLLGSVVPLVILITLALDQIKITYKKIYAFTMVGVTLLAGVMGHYLYNVPNKGMTTTWVNKMAAQVYQGDALLALNDNGVIAAMTYAPDLDLYKLTSCGQEAWGSLSPATRDAMGVKYRTPEQLLKGFAGPYNTVQPYTRLFFISTIAPISPQCEIDQANEIINYPGVIQIENLHDDQYSQAGVYLIPSQDGRSE